MVAETLSVGDSERQSGLTWKRVRRATHRLSWGIADQAVSSITNFAVSIYVARVLGATQLGAFSLAYVTYGFLLNASRGLATDPLLVRFSNADVPSWRRAVASCTGTAAVVGLAAGVFALGAAMLMSGTARAAFLALGLTLPGLLLQDSWRFAFFALGRGYQAFLNDLVWAAVMVPALYLLNRSGHADAFWFVFAWGAAATVAAAVGPLQARVIPRVSQVRQWLSSHRDLGPRYLLEGTANSASTQLRNYAVGLVLGLAAVGYVQASSSLIGPFMVIFFGMGLVTLPEAARVLRRSPRYLPVFCMLISGGLALLALTWGAILLVALPRGLGNWLIPHLWRSTYPLILPLTISVVGGCLQAGAGTGLHALGAARRSARVMVVSSAIFVVCGVTGALLYGTVGTMWGAAAAGWIGAVMFWWELRSALGEASDVMASLRYVGTTPLQPVRPPHARGRHRKAAA
jgi:O-antigen/teichoic acid export membrane protein